MIPKIIHFCWFGKSIYSPLMAKCIDTWKQVLPEYEFKLWNEDTFDINSTEWTKHSYQIMSDCLFCINMVVYIWTQM